jgi:hypothetical protein
MIKRLGYSLLCLLAFASCKREADEVQPTPKIPDVIIPNPVADFLKTAVSDPTAPEFISGEFDGHVLNFASDKWSEAGCTYRAGTDQALFVRQNRSGDIQVNLNLNYMNLFTATMPNVWPRDITNPLFCQGFFLDLYSLGQDNSLKALFQGATGSQIVPYSRNRMKFTVTSVQDNFVEGTFEGPLYINANGPFSLSYYHDKYGDISYSSVDVKNGKFRIKAHVL